MVSAPVSPWGRCVWAWGAPPLFVNDVMTWGSPADAARVPVLSIPSPTPSEDGISRAPRG
jgi:hypothetical protein